MTEVCAAMGLTSLETMDSVLETNLRKLQAYCEGLDGLPGNLGDPIRSQRTK